MQKLDYLVYLQAFNIKFQLKFLLIFIQQFIYPY